MKARKNAWIRLERSYDSLFGNQTMLIADELLCPSFLYEQLDTSLHRRRKFVTRLGYVDVQSVEIGSKVKSR